MKVLMVNKFLHPNGGSETYIFRLGEQLQKMGHEVQYFGMEHEGRIVGNRVNAYTSNMDFHSGSKFSKLIYPLKTIYSVEARKQIRKVLDDFKPDVVHLNNFNYQLTPSVIVETVSWRKKTGKECRIVYTAHDGQFVCPNHMLYNPNTKEVCQKCLGGHYLNCLKNKCIHGSGAKSVVGTAESVYWRMRGVYKYVDQIICPSEFMKKILDSDPKLANKTQVLQNFYDRPKREYDSDIEKKDYVLYFGRYSEEKGIRKLIEVCRNLPEVQFVFAGSGPLESELEGVKNIKNVGFQTGADLVKLISEAKFTVYPSECYENCPFSIIESLMCGTPVLGADIGGIPELIDQGIDGELFKAFSADDLKEKMEAMYTRKFDMIDSLKFADSKEYCEKMIKIYQGTGV